MTSLAPILESVFTRRLLGQRQASPNTIAAYRDALRLLLQYARQETGKDPQNLCLEDLDASLAPYSGSRPSTIQSMLNLSNECS